MANWFQKRMEQEHGGPLPPPAPAVHGYPQGSPPQQAPQQAQPQQQGFDVDQLEKTPENVKLMMQYWTGGEGTKTEVNRCPSCGSDHYFSRSQGVMRGPAPAALCYTCGFNGMFEQADQSNWTTE